MTHLSATPSSVSVPHPLGYQTRNGSPPSHRTTRFLVFLFCSFYHPGFRAELRLGGMAMGMHAVLQKAHFLAFI